MTILFESMSHVDEVLPAAAQRAVGVRAARTVGGLNTGEVGGMVLMLRGFLPLVSCLDNGSYFSYLRTKLLLRLRNVISSFTDLLERFEYVATNLPNLTFHVLLHRAHN